MPVFATIRLPCTARALEETLRGFCEQHGCYDTAMVRALSYEDKDALGGVVVLRIFANMEDAKK